MIKGIQEVSGYRIVRKIADGGMGSVYEAIQDGANGFQKVVALKFLLPQMSDPRYVQMFIQEAKLVANLVHENIVQIYQLGRSEEGYYIVMEFVNGLSLQEFMRVHTHANRYIPTELTVFIGARIARGLAYAHSRNDAYQLPLRIVHRDVCPNNVLITTEGLPKLTDFGIAVGSFYLETPNLLMGKLTYMSPEQAHRQPLDFRADLFSLGAVIFEMLSNHAIRRSGSEGELIVAAREGTVAWDLLPPTVPPAVRLMLEKCLARDPNDRYASADELAHDLEYFIYKDGYGPTIQTLEAYLRKQCPFLYQPSLKTLSRRAEIAEETTKVLIPDATLIRD